MIEKFSGGCVLKAKAVTGRNLVIAVGLIGSRWWSLTIRSKEDTFLESECVLSLC